ncbi:MAG: hypothetical protein HY785_17320 [Oscillatoriophycideae cyanobacterium NC_groundwater_1537_Pr4_S-0.65um_50_18]|nr:hypothetical protein [Oscillatoriophycideae cyanobacterium NC_groundwater_1537_Pr4_S-0.65um_50_18]
MADSNTQKWHCSIRLHSSSELVALAPYQTILEPDLDCYPVGSAQRLTTSLTAIATSFTCLHNLQGDRNSIELYG